MATLVCQGMQTCLESQVVESRTLRLRVCSPKPHFSQSLELALKHSSLDSSTKELTERRSHDEDKSKSSSAIQNPDMGGWSFLQDLPNASSGSKESMEKDNNVYVHPLSKRYSSSLSDKSLELCTENLGSETGTVDVIDNSIFESLLSSLVSKSEAEAVNSPTREQQHQQQQQEQQQQQQKPRQPLGAKKANYSRSFPPPLTTMSGLESLQVRPHREDGRLIIKAVKAPSKHSYFQAERSHGRLRLSFVKDSASNFDLDEENEATSEAKNSSLETENDTTNSDEAQEMEEEEGEEEAEEEEEHHQEVEKQNGARIEGNGLDDGAEIGIMEDFQRPTRCKEGELENKGLLNWEPFLVATS